MAEGNADGGDRPTPGPIAGIYSESNGLVTDSVYCLVKIIEKDERIIAAVQFEI